MLLNYPAIRTQSITSPVAEEKQVVLQVLRLDEIHPVVSGNKIFKLKHFINDPQNKRVVTFGGAYSNHLVATAFACRENNINCIGIVRGEKPQHLSHTLQQCIEYGMQLNFISRDEYDKKDNLLFKEKLAEKYSPCIIVHEGGYDAKGAAGASSIMNYVSPSTTHICCAVGTATTVAGLLMNVKPYQTIIAVPVLKGMTDIAERIDHLTAGQYNPQQLHIEGDYHFGGYAKKTTALVDFMNEFYNNHQLPTDFVYTAKMMYATMELIRNNFFPPGSNICCIHTGGLQGNLSLPKGTLTF